jgi:hypothetical protein
VNKYRIGQVLVWMAWFGVVGLLVVIVLMLFAYT